MGDYYWVIIVVFVVGVFAIKRMGMVGRTEARRLMEAGAKVIDVRSQGEFSTGHCAGATNIPLNAITERIEREVADKETPILVYCLSGTRSGAAARLLRGQGYTQVHNLGSLGRAKRIVGK
ncbi:MAG: rhodanese-like domain-containing protein [Verrucomicrobiota bacterium]|jgi:phage shock protein E|nr:rhodanese-like domain-containing protein [Verrucomicrobiota bacterium]